MRCLCTRSAPRLTSCVRCRSQRLRDQGLVHGCKLHGPQGGGHGRGLWPLRLLAGRHGGRRHRQAFRGCPLRPHPRPQIGPLRRTLCRPGASVPPRVESRCPETEHPSVQRVFLGFSGVPVHVYVDALRCWSLCLSQPRRTRDCRLIKERPKIRRGPEVRARVCGPGPPDDKGCFGKPHRAGKTRPRAPLPC